MELYLYTNINYLRDVLGANAIVCTATCDKARTPSLGIISSSKLFLTHKKVNSDIRSIGLDTSLNNGEIPVVLQLEFIEKYMADTAIQRVQIVDGKVEVIDAKMSEYDMTKDEGCFIKALIPLTYLKSIIFETRDDYKQVFTPSPDMWYPEEIYSEIVVEDFNDSIDYELIESSIDESEEEIKNAKDVVTLFEKKRAINYYALKMTENWEIDRYKFNVDPYIIKSLKLDPQRVAESLRVSVEEVCPANYKDTLCSDDYLGKINGIIIQELMAKDITTEFEVSVFDGIIAKILPESEMLEEKQKLYVDEAVKVIRESLYSVKGLPFAKVLEKTNAVAPLKALLCLLKYPHDFENISGTLVQYGVGQEASRLTAMYFAAVHGMEFWEGVDKNNLLLERTIDEVSAVEGIIPIYTEDDYKMIFDRDVSVLLRPMYFVSEKIVRMEDVFEFFNGNRARIQVSKIKKSIGKAVDWDKYLRYVVPDAYKPGEALTKKQAEDFAKMITTPVEETDKFIEEYFASPEAFKPLYDVKPDFWKTYYKSCKGKK